MRRSSPQLRGTHMMGLDLGKPPGEGLRSCIAEEMHLAALAEQLGRQRFGRKQMTAGAAGREHEGPAHSSPPPRRRRVSASIIPIPSPSASSEDPPYDRNGNVMPFVGMRCRLDAMLIAACSPN